MGDIPSLFSEVLKSSSKKKPFRVLGIDLGTTNSVAAEIVFDPKHSDRLEARCLNIDQPTLGGRFTHSAPTSPFDSRPYQGLSEAKVLWWD